MFATKWTLTRAADKLRPLGISLKIKHGEYIVNYMMIGQPKTAYRTGDLADAVRTGKWMARNRQAALDAPAVDV